MVGPNLPTDHPMWLPYQAWDQLRENLQYSFDNGADGEIYREGSPELIAERSPVYLVLKWIKERVTVEGLTAVASVARLGSKPIDWMAAGEAIPALMFRQYLSEILLSDGADKASALQTTWLENEAHANDAEARISKLSQDITAIAGTIQSVEQRERAALEKIEAELATIEVVSGERIQQIKYEIELLSERSATIFSDLIAQANGRIADWTNGYEEEKQLQAPVVLWNGRANYHEQRLRSRQFWMIGVGIIGLLLCVAVAISTFLSSNWLFEDVIEPVTNPSKGSVDGVKAIFKYQLLTTSATTLLFLTMYIWAMKLLVRLYSTEHHLAIDAKGRAALTETYLGLTKEGKATDADRAIMLAVLFRPVADGMVKEESPPAISPAAIIAGLASNPGK